MTTESSGQPKALGTRWTWSLLAVLALAGISLALFRGASFSSVAGSSPATQSAAAPAAATSPPAPTAASVTDPAVPATAVAAAEKPQKPPASARAAAPAAAADRGGPADEASPAHAPTTVVVDAGPPPSENVRITFDVVPSRRATIRWGKESLGVIPRGGNLVVERPRDSGPLDVVIRSPGYLTVHTRAYTFDDNTVDVRLTPRDAKDRLFGYKKPLPPADAGAPPATP